MAQIVPSPVRAAERLGERARDVLRPFRAGEFRWLVTWASARTLASAQAITSRAFSPNHWALIIDHFSSADLYFDGFPPDSPAAVNSVSFGAGPLRSRGSFLATASRRAMRWSRELAAACRKAGRNTWTRLATFQPNSSFT